MTDEHSPILVGAAQLTLRDAEPQAAPGPLATLARVARAAAEDAGAGDRALSVIDTVGVVQVAGWKARNGPRLLAETLQAKPNREIVTATGGEIPLTLVNDIASRIADGEARVALVAGSNNLRTLRRARKAGLRLDWERGGGGEPALFGENRMGSSERERDYGLNMPADVYPVFENALRARRGLGLEDHRRRVGALMSRFSAVAARNPHAWFPVERSAEEITTPTTRNRMIAFPYTKYMNAVLETDQAAAVLMMSAGAARALGVPEAKWVYWWGGAHGQERAWFPSERPDFAACPSLRDTVGRALVSAGVALEAIDHVDLYSCFPVAVEMACAMIGLDEEDPRGLTVTGGLPYAGGPGNNYTLHSLAAMMERVRARSGATGLVTGNGWYLTKHSACVVSSAPPGPGEAPRPAATREPLPTDPQPPADAVRGSGTVEAYTVQYDREGAPTRGIVLGRMEDGRRFLANTPADRALLEAFVAVEEVGRRGRLSAVDGRQVFEPA
jgi:acetyl-CoA C-acetyltransferase